MNKSPPPSGLAPKTTVQERLVEALRANLIRRKAQQRARSHGSSPENKFAKKKAEKSP